MYWNFWAIFIVGVVCSVWMEVWSCGLSLWGLLMWYMGNGCFEGTTICECVCFFIAKYAYVGPDFMYCDLMQEPCDEVYYRGNEEFVWVVGG